MSSNTAARSDDVLTIARDRATGSFFSLTVIANAQFAIESKLILECRSTSRATLLNMGPTMVRGIVCVKGKVVPIIHLGDYLPKKAHSRASLLVIVKQHRRIVGIEVESVGVQVMYEGDFQPIDHPFARTALVQTNKLIPILDVSLLL